MTTIRWIILAAIVAGIVLAFIYVNRYILGAACFIAGMVVHNNWNVIVRKYNEAKK